MRFKWLYENCIGGIQTNNNINYYPGSGGTGGSGKVKYSIDHDGAQGGELSRPTTSCCGENTYHLFVVFNFVHLFCSPLGPIWAQLDPYGPVYNFIWFRYSCLLFLYMVLGGFTHDF